MKSILDRLNFKIERQGNFDKIIDAAGISRAATFYESEMWNLLKEFDAKHQIDKDEKPLDLIKFYKGGHMEPLSNLEKKIPCAKCEKKTRESELCKDALCNDCTREILIYQNQDGVKNG